MGPDYELGLDRLRSALLRILPQMPPEFGPLEVRLQRNLRESRIYGDDPANRVEWAKIMDALIQLANEHLGINFNDLCNPGADEIFTDDRSTIVSLREQAKGKSEHLSDASDPRHYRGTGKRWAVLVGADIYKDKTYHRLRVCSKDLVAISQQLEKSGFLPDHTQMLSDAVPGQLPTRENILTTLKQVAQATQPDDLLFFYYTGHGDVDESESYLVANNGYFVNLEHTAVSITQVKKIMQQAPARAKVIILDACHGGAAIGAKGPRRMSPTFIRRVFEQAEGMAILSSCTQGQISYEWEKQARSVFTYYLLEALQGRADYNDKGFVTIADVHHYVTDRVGGWAIRNKKPQTPTLQAEMIGEIIVCHYLQT